MCFSCTTGIGLTLNNVQYTNNSVVNITDIGTDSAALICTTTRPTCCLSTDGSHWYFPDGSTVQRTGTTYYRTRTVTVISGTGTVRLHRNPGATTTGIFRCDIPDASGDLQSLYVGIYTATTGESCALKSSMSYLGSMRPWGRGMPITKKHVCSVVYSYQHVIKISHGIATQISFPVCGPTKNDQVIHV